jgi:hypothetical protein
MFHARYAVPSPPSHFYHVVSRQKYAKYEPVVGSRRCLPRAAHAMIPRELRTPLCASLAAFHDRPPTVSRSRSLPASPAQS